MFFWAIMTNVTNDSVILCTFDWPKKAIIYKYIYNEFYSKFFLIFGWAESDAVICHICHFCHFRLAEFVS